MLLRQLFDPESSTYTYLLADQESAEAMIIDPVLAQVERDEKLIKELGLKLLFAFDTHIHADHVSGIGRLGELTGCKTGLSATSGAVCQEIKLREGDTFSLGGKVNISVLETPGHTDGCLSFLSNGFIMSGDCLIIRGCGRTDFQQGDAGRLYDSITRKLLTLPDETAVYPAHDYHGMTVSSIGEEKRFNPRLSLGREEFIHFMTEQLNLPKPKRMHEAVPANLACGKANTP